MTGRIRVLLVGVILMAAHEVLPCRAQAPDHDFAAFSRQLDSPRQEHEEAGFSALVLRVPEQHLDLVLLANGERVWWGNPLDRAEVEGSPFARAFLDRFVFHTGGRGE